MSAASRGAPGRRRLLGPPTRTYRRGGLVAVALFVAVAAAAIVQQSPGDATRSAFCLTGGAAAEAGLPAPQRNEWVTRSGSTLRLGSVPWRFTGVNMYWLGRDDNLGDAAPTHEAVANGFAAAAALGARLVRSTSLGVSVGSPGSVEPSLGHFDDAAFASIDYAVAVARQHGVRLMIPLTDQWRYYHGGKHTFTNWLGHRDLPQPADVTVPAQQAQEAYFYTDPAVVSAFHAYVRHILTHVNPRTGLALGRDPTIAIWETGNELYDATAAWTEQTARFVKTLAPHALVADGSAASGKDVTTTAAAEPDVDIVDAHYYPTDRPKALADAAYVAGQRKVFMVGEYPLTGTGLGPWLAALAGSPHVAGDLAWSLLPRTAGCAPEPHADGYTFHYPGASAAERRATASLLQHARAVTR